ncbi:MAG: hypothetical protein AABZ10_13340, partial [Nitrospirota bacterium]
MRMRHVINLSTAVAAFVLAGCAALMQGLPPGEDAPKFQEAKTHFEQGNYKEARSVYLGLVEGRPESRSAEPARFRAASILVYHNNPDKDYGQALREFEEFLARYPESRFAGEAGSWLSMLKNFEQSRANELLKEAASLTKKLEEARAFQREAQAGKEAASKERDALLMEKENHIKKIDGLLNDKDQLLKETAALLKERDALGRERAVLEKRVDALTREKEGLVLAKERLEKSIKELMLVDVKMEKKRKK